MSLYTIQDTTLIGIGDAIRAKGGTSDAIPVTGLANAITNLPSGGGEGTGIPSVVNSDASHNEIALSYGGSWDWLLSELGETRFNFDKGSLRYCFYESEMEDLSHLTLYAGGAGYGMFKGCGNLRQLPKIYTDWWESGEYAFSGCNNLREIPSDFFAARDKDGNLLGKNVFETNPNLINTTMTYVFQNCRSLRGDIPIIYPRAGGTNLLAYFAYNLFSIDQITNIPVGSGSAMTSNKLSNFVSNLFRIKEFKFATQEDGTPYTVKWKSQTIDLASNNVGYCSNSSGWPDNYNNGITIDTKVTDDASYQALKNDPDWWTYDYNYSRYNHDSAVNTINSLPDASAYLATQSSGTNTIKFKGAAGTNTDGGAINTLTEEEIAVATAKGWTVTLS